MDMYKIFCNMILHELHLILSLYLLLTFENNKHNIYMLYILDSEMYTV